MRELKNIRVLGAPVPVGMIPRYALPIAITLRLQAETEQAVSLDGNSGRVADHDLQKKSPRGRSIKAQISEWRFFKKHWTFTDFAEVTQLHLWALFYQRNMKPFRNEGWNNLSFNLLGSKNLFSTAINHGFETCLRTRHFNLEMQ